MEKSKSYEGLFIIHPDKLDVIDQVKDSIGAVISDNSGNVVKENVVEKKTLAYPIKKKKEGIYYEITFTALPGSVPKMMRKFRINTDIMRTLIDKNG